MFSAFLNHSSIRPTERKLLEELGSSSQLTREDLLRLIGEFEARQKDAIKEFEFLDLDLAEKLAERARRLLNSCEPGDEQWTTAVAAVRYLVEDDDAVSDTGRIDGLSDDEHVLDAAEDVLGIDS